MWAGRSPVLATDVEIFTNRAEGQTFATSTHDAGY